MVGAAPTGDAPTTSEWSTILLPTEARLILQVHIWGTRNCCFVKIELIVYIWGEFKGLSIVRLLQTYVINASVFNSLKCGCLQSPGYRGLTGEASKLLEIPPLISWIGNARRGHLPSSERMCSKLSTEQMILSVHVETGVSNIFYTLSVFAFVYIG